MDRPPPLSETEAIRILRASPRRDAVRNQTDSSDRMKACHNALDVLRILERASRFPKTIIGDDQSLQLLSEVESIVDEISPNVAAAALRRLSSPPFLLPARSERKSHQYRRDHLGKASAEERQVYKQLMKLLLSKLSSAMESQWNDLATSTSRSDNVNAQLLPHKESWLAPPTFSGIDETNTLNWYALADMLHSISSLCHVLGKRHRGGNIIKDHLLTNISPQQQSSMMDLFERIVEYLSWEDKMTSSFVRCVGPKRLARDVFHPLALMASARNGGHGEIIDSAESGSYDRLLDISASYLALPHSLETLTAMDISSTLGSMRKIHQPPPSNSLSRWTLQMKTPQRLLLRVFMRRLRKHSVRSSDQGLGLVQAASSVARLIGYLEDQDQTKPSHLPQKVLPVPIRLPGEEDGDTHQSSPFLLPSPPPDNATTIRRDSTDIPTKTLHDEAVIMFHTLINEVVHPPKFPADKDHAGSGIRESESMEKTKLQSLTLGGIADLLQAATFLDPRGQDPATVRAILKHLASNPLSPRSVLQRCRNCRDISRLLMSLQRLRVGSGKYDDPVGITDFETSSNDCRLGSEGTEEKMNNGNNAQGLEEQCVQLLSERFLDIVLWRRNQARPPCDPKTLATTLRSGVLMFPGESSATAGLLDAASMLILDGANDGEGDEDWERPSFLSRSNEFEVSNYLFAYALAKRFDEDIFTALTDQMTEDHILESCTSSSASRAMWACAMLLSIDEASNKKSNQFTWNQSFLQERLVDLFHQLAPLLLYSPLSPTDASCAMWSMAKAQYVIDRGIFDQLAESLTSEDMLSQSNTRLISQALWACGKMVEFDSFESEGELPPYVECVATYIDFLVGNEAKMTPKHLSQSIWAIGRLRLSDPAHIDEMARIALSKIEQLNARESANIVWGLSRVDCGDNADIICELVHHVTKSETLTEQCKAHEASNMLLALGKLGVCDDDAFSCLSSILKGRLDEAESQTIANALWAHEVVGIAPPPELLSTWAQTKLGLGTALIGGLSNDIGEQ